MMKLQQSWKWWPHHLCVKITLARSYHAAWLGDAEHFAENLPLVLTVIENLLQVS
jgi:hypothetical protein